MKQKTKLNNRFLKLSVFAAFFVAAFLFSLSNSDSFIKTASATTQVSTYDKVDEFPPITATEKFDNFTDTYDNSTNTHTGTINFAFTYGNPNQTCGIYGWMRLKSFTLYDVGGSVVYTRNLNPSFNPDTNLKTASWSGISGSELGRVEVTLWVDNNYPGGFSGPPPGTYICNAGSTNQVQKTRIPDKNPPVITSGPTTVTVYGAAQLAIYDTPTATLSVNGTSSVTINPGTTASVYWSSHAANTGDSCTAANTASDSSWSGAKSSGGGNQAIGPINTPGSYTYSIYCTGALGSTSPTATVTVNVNNPSFSINCTPATASIVAGSSTSYNVTITGQNGFAGQVSFSADVAGPPLPKGKTKPSVSFSPNPSGVGVVVALVTTNASTTATGTYTITITGASAGFTNQTCNVTLQVSNQTPPSPPTAVSAANPPCGVVDITWENSPGSPTPTAYRIYRRTSISNPWQQLGSDIAYVAGSTQVYYVRDSSPLSVDGSNYYAVAAVANGIESSYAEASPSPIVPIACAPNVSSSDKDVVSVSGRINRSFSPIPCSGTSEIAALPNGALYAPGDVITFRINVCNTGTQEMTNVSVTDTYTNLSNLTVLPLPKGSCVTGSSVGPGSVTITMDNIAATNGVCSVTLTGVVTSPPNPSAAIYRFQNRGMITADNGIAKEVHTPPYLFSVTGGVPDRGETAPPSQGGGQTQGGR